MKEYTDYITVTDSNYGKALRDSFNSVMHLIRLETGVIVVFPAINSFIGPKAMTHGQITKIGAIQMI